MKYLNSHQLHDGPDATLCFNPASRKQDLHWKEYLPVILLGVILLGLLIPSLLW